MKFKPVLWISLGCGMLVFCSPILFFVLKHVVAGYQEAELSRRTAPATTEPASTPVSGPVVDVKRLAQVDFSKLDYGTNIVTVKEHGAHRVEKLPPLNGTGRNGYREGLVQQGNFEVRGAIEAISGASFNRLPSSEHAGGLVTLELTVEKGTVRAYLMGLDGSWVSGYVFVDVTPGHPGRVTGYLQDWSDTGSPHQDFYVESRDGDAQGIAYRVYRKE